MNTIYHRHRTPDHVMFRSTGIILTGQQAYSTVTNHGVIGFHKDIIRIDSK